MFKYRIKNKVVGLFLVVMGLGFFPLSGSGQTFAEFFKQKKTQKKYLLEQIAALQVYLDYARKGYEIAGSGLRTIKDLSNGEFSLHSSFFSSLSVVSPWIRNNKKVLDIAALQLEILRTFEELIKGNGTGFLSASNLFYLNAVRAKVLLNCAEDLKELLLVLSPGLLELDDKARLDWLDQLLVSMQDKAAFSRSFSANVLTLIGSREMDLRSIQFLNRAYGNVE